MKHNMLNYGTLVTVRRGSRRVLLTSSAERIHEAVELQAEVNTTVILSVVYPGSLVMGHHLFSHPKQMDGHIYVIEGKEFWPQAQPKILVSFMSRHHSPGRLSSPFPPSLCLSLFTHCIKSDAQWDTKRLQMATVASFESAIQKKSLQVRFSHRGAQMKLYLLQSQDCQTCHKGTRVAAVELWTHNSTQTRHWLTNGQFASWGTETGPYWLKLLAFHFKGLEQSQIN